ncbi:MAG: hypothetical protein FWD56_04295 [Bacteroidales bacterium]|nr:hypothetical protein [Bacteroidales bacterium]
MKKLLLLFFAGMIVINGCKDVVIETVLEKDIDIEMFTYMVNEPIFMDTKAFRESVSVTTKAQPINNHGKMCFYQGYLYVSETEKGIHIINNNDPSKPQNVGFIELIGNVDLAIRNDKLYADSYMDLVWFDISDPQKPELEGRLEDVFTKYFCLPLTRNNYLIDYRSCFDENGAMKGIVVGWNVTERTDISSIYDMVYLVPFREFGVIRAQIASSPSPSSSINGVNGSMSRFALYDHYMYSVINNFMSIIDLNGNQPEKVVENIYIGWEVETIFNYKEYMFMGTPTGMLIYSVADPLKPVFIRAIFHIFGCDPVVVEDDIAYVTIHSGNFCGQNNNELIIYDVSDVYDPRHIVSYAMKNPKGLGIDNGTLFVCDDGLKIFDAANPQTIMANRLAHYSGMDGYDVIPFDNVLMMIADDGLYQYDYSDLTQIHLLSKLPIEKQ